MAEKGTEAVAQRFSRFTDLFQPIKNWFSPENKEEEGEGGSGDGKKDEEKAGDKDGENAGAQNSGADGDAEGGEGGVDNDRDGEGGDKDDDDKEEEEKVVLLKSTRLKGYITLAVASAINYVSAIDSDDAGDWTNVVPANETQRRYAMALSLASGILSLFAIFVHFDSYTCLKGIWIKAFKPKARFERVMLAFLVIWWIVGTWVQTSFRGIAGDGKGQYNLYFSTWLCCWTSIWTLDRCMVAADFPSINEFISSWPNRAPGWIVIFFLTIADLLCVLDLYMHWDSTRSKNSVYLDELFSNVSNYQWNWLIFINALSIPTAAVFFLIEVFRVTKPGVKNSKSDLENVIEGIIISTMVCAWIPTVIIATTPGGVASLVGNTYFFTWACTVVIIETFVWWVRDWRKGLHDIVRQQEEEYQRAKEAVLAQKYKQKTPEKEDEL